MSQTPVTFAASSATTRPQSKEHVGLTFRFLISALILAGVAGCGPNYSPDTYASNAAQQANKVEQGVIVGVRNVAVTAAGTVGTVTGAAAGGIAGSQVGVGPISAFTSLGGALVGGIGGSAVEHVSADTTAFEYIVRKPNGDLVSVTQKDKTPLVLGQKVLVIAGNQARVLPDYTAPPLSPPAKAAETAKADAAAAETKPADAKPADVKPADAKPADATAPVATPAAMPPDAKPVAAALDGKTPLAGQSGAAPAPATPDVKSAEPTKPAGNTTP
jgi:outer membrane lipoprotein SlyB